MGEKLKVGIFVDSFYPVVDGVSQVVNNYCKYLNKYDDVDVTLVTPRYPNAQYGKYSFKIYPYTSFGSNKSVGYRVGWPFVLKTVNDVKNMDFDIIHIHAPLCSSELARLVNKNKSKKAKIVLTYHTKYDVDFEARLKTALFKKIAYAFLKANVNAADEVWIVSEGSEEALRRVGFTGKCRVMENGVDFVKEPQNEEKCRSLKEKLGIPENCLVFSFVGRLQWYKNLKLICDALKIAKADGLDFRMLFVGDGTDADDVKSYVSSLGLNDKVIFTGSVNNRDELRIYYSITDLFLFLSTFDTAAIVVKEAAACNCPVLFAEGSDSAYGVKDGVNGWFSKETPECLAEKIEEVTKEREKLKEVGISASNSLYVPWSASVDNALKRYKELVLNKK